MHLRSGAVFLLVVAFFCLISSPLVRAQEEVIDGQITIKKVEVDQFPIVVVQILATDENGRNLNELSNLVIKEDGQEGLPY